MSQTTQLSELARALSRNRGTGMGIDPMLPSWKASVLRLSHGAPVLPALHSYEVQGAKYTGSCPLYEGQSI